MVAQQQESMVKGHIMRELMAGQPTAHRFLLHQRLITHIILLL
jgi:hypothetical protein